MSCSIFGHSQKRKLKRLPNSIKIANVGSKICPNAKSKFSGEISLILVTLYLLKND